MAFRLGEGDGRPRNGEGPNSEFEPSFPASRLGLMLAFLSISVLFGALAVLYIARLPDRPDYPFKPPASLWISTIILLASGVSCQLALVAVRNGAKRRALYFLSVTFVLGIGFLFSQLLAWLQLQAAGVYAQSNPFSGLFFIITALHGIHLIAGLLWLAACIAFARKGAYTPKRHAGLRMALSYWHFMDVVWLALFGLLMLL